MEHEDWTPVLDAQRRSDDRVIIDALVAALEPFAARCKEAVRPDDTDNDGVTVKTRHLRAALAALALARGKP